MPGVTAVGLHHPDQADGRIYRLEDQLLVVLDVDKLLDYGHSAAA